MEKAPSVCIFQEVLSACKPSKIYADKKLSERQKETIKKCRYERNDNFSLLKHTDLCYHKDCYADYTSSSKIARLLNKKNETLRQQEEEASPVKRTRR